MVNPGQLIVLLLFNLDNVVCTAGVCLRRCETESTGVYRVDTYRAVHFRYGCLYKFLGEHHDGHPIYVFRLPSGKETRVYRKGDVWVNTTGAKSREIKHMGGDTNLPPTGKGWVRPDGTLSTLSFSVADGFERKLKTVAGRISHKPCSCCYRQLGGTDIIYAPRMYWSFGGVSLCAHGTCDTPPLITIN